MEHPRHDLRLYDYGNFTEEFLVSLAKKLNVPVVYSNAIARKLGLPETGNENMRAHAEPNEKFYFRMHPSGAYGFDYSYVSSRDRKFIEYLLAQLSLLNRGKNYTTDRLMWRKENSLVHLRDQTLVTLGNANALLGRGIILTKDYKDIVWSEVEVPATGDKKHRPIVRTFLIDGYEDYQVSTLINDKTGEKVRSKKFSYFDNGLGQLDYSTSHGYKLRVIGRVRFFGERFRVKPHEIGKISKEAKIHRMQDFYRQHKTYDVTVSSTDAIKVKKMLGKTSISDAIKLKPAIVMEDLFPFTVDEGISRGIYEKQIEVHTEPQNQENLTANRLS